MKIIEIVKEYCQEAIPVNHISRIIENKDRDTITIITDEHGETRINVGREKCHYIYCEILKFLSKDYNKISLIQINEKTGHGYYYVNLNDSLPDSVF